MIDIDKIINPSERDASSIISDLKDTSIKVPAWDELLKDYEPLKHRVCFDKINLKDKKNGTEKSARIPIGLERLLVNRINEFTFAIPVKRVYNHTEDDTEKEIQHCIERIFQQNHINSVNLKRGVSYYAACEIFTIWYAVKKPNSLYGFPCDYKLKCKTYSPMDGVRLYPLIDELDDMVAMSFQYDKDDGEHTTTYFETYTKDRHYVWKQSASSIGWQEETAKVSEDGEVLNGEEIIIGKIPGVYLYRTKPVYHGLKEVREEIEYTLSRNSNVIAYNSAPVLKVSGGVEGEEDKGESRRIVRTENGGDVSYVSWSQAIDALKYHVDTMLKMFWMQSQMPDVSFDNMRSLGNIGFDARQTLLMDAHLRIGDESGAWVEFFEREINVVKAFLKQMNKKWADKVDNVTAEIVITPYVQNDELSDINKRLKANGGKAIESQLESIRRMGRSDDPEATLQQIQEEAQQEALSKSTGLALQNQEY